MAKKRHGGLGRGLDALIPRAAREGTGGQEAVNKNKETGREVTGTATDAVDPLADPSMNTSMTSTDPSANASTDASTDPSANASTDPSADLSANDSTDPSADPSAKNSTDASGDLSGNSSGDISTEHPADFSQESFTDPSGSVKMLRLSQVDPNRSQPRKNFEDEALEELADSIRQFGVLQPILVQKKGSRYEIIAGERRWRASRKAGLMEIPAIVREYSDRETLELSLIENIQREDLNPIEEARAFKRLLEEFGLRQEDLAARVSKSRTAITNALRLLKLDDRVQNMLITQELSMGHARALLPVEIPEEQFLLAQQAAEKHLSVRDVEKMIRNRKAGKKTVKAAAGRAGKEADPALELAYKEIEERLKQALGTKAAIRSSGDGTGKLEIEFYSHEDLEKIVDLLTET